MLFAGILKYICMHSYNIYASVCKCTLYVPKKHYVNVCLLLIQGQRFGATKFWAT